jgi:hypothetical protein
MKKNKDSVFIKLLKEHTLIDTKFIDIFFNIVFLTRYNKGNIKLS